MNADVKVKAYKIVNWVCQYELDMSGHATNLFAPPLPIEKLRKSPIPYIRLHGKGHSQTVVDRRINKKAWRAGQIIEMAVHGVYDKLLLIAKEQVRDFRGWILDDRQQPMYAEQIAECLGVYEVGRLQEILDLLCQPEIGLLELCEYRQTCANLRKSPEVCASFLNETETEGKKIKPKEPLQANTPPEPHAGDGQLLISDSGSQNSFEVSASVSTDEIRKKTDTTALLWQDCFHPKKTSDATTLRHILNHLQRCVIKEELTLEIFDVASDIAKSRECLDARKPIAFFIAAMKEPRFGYVPLRRRLISSGRY